MLVAAAEDEDDDTGPADVLQAALDGSGYLAEMEAENTVESAGRIENLGELVGSAREFTRLGEFLEQVALVADTDELDADDKVVLMTLHSAKGLEFPVVFVIGMEDGVFPHIRALNEPTEMEEERRLAYVGITRAQELLHLSPRVEPPAVRHHELQRAVTVPRRDPHRAGQRAGQRRRSRLVRAAELPPAGVVRRRPAALPAHGTGDVRPRRGRGRRVTASGWSMRRSTPAAAR